MKNRMILLIALSIITTIGLAGCRNEAINLENTTWVLESGGEQWNMQTVLEGSEITAVFDSDEGRVKGSAGCNSYFASYQASNKQLSISTIASTEMFCGEPIGIMEQEYRYLSILEAAQTYQIQGRRLKISSLGGQELAFRAQ